VVGGNYVDIRVRRQAAARWGLNVADVQEIVASAIGGRNVTETIEGLERYPVNLRYPRELRGDLESLASVAVPTPMGHTVPLTEVAELAIAKGPTAIKSENARRSAWIYIDLDTSDIGGYVEAASRALESEVSLPTGVSLVWSGQFEYMERANARLRLIVPITLGFIFLLLYVHFRRVGESLIVMTGTILFAPIGGVWLLWLFDFNLSIAVGVGFIALAGLATETSVVMLAYLDERRDRFQQEGRLTDLEALRRAVSEGAVDRVRPLLMTVATTFFGLLPVLYGSGTGTRIMKRIATPMVGGLVSATVLTLIVLPAVYLLWHARGLPAPEKVNGAETRSRRSSHEK
jgi:Cu(I)/Ag(I) efflux system membrane protein CusA/SilA